MLICLARLSGLERPLWHFGHSNRAVWKCARRCLERASLLLNLLWHLSKLHLKILALVCAVMCLLRYPFLAKVLLQSLNWHMTLSLRVRCFSSPRAVLSLLTVLFVTDGTLIVASVAVGFRSRLGSSWMYVDGSVFVIDWWMHGATSDWLFVLTGLLTPSTVCVFSLYCFPMS